MRKLIVMIVFSAFSALLLKGQGPAFFENEVLGIAFASETQWTEVISGEPGSMELVNCNQNLHLKMWYEPTMNSAESCLSEILGNEGLNCSTESFSTTVDQHPATAVIAGCTEMRRPVKVLLIAVKNNEGFYILRFKCPDECFRDHRKQMNELIKTIMIRPVEERYICHVPAIKHS